LQRSCYFAALTILAWATAPQAGTITRNDFDAVWNIVPTSEQGGYRILVTPALSAELGSDYAILDADDKFVSFREYGNTTVTLEDTQPLDVKCQRFGGTDPGSRYGCPLGGRPADDIVEVRVMGGTPDASHDTVTGSVRQGSDVLGTFTTAITHYRIGSNSPAHDAGYFTAIVVIAPRALSDLDVQFSIDVERAATRLSQYARLRSSDAPFVQWTEAKLLDTQPGGVYVYENPLPIHSDTIGKITLATPVDASAEYNVQGCKTAACDGSGESIRVGIRQMIAVSNAHPDYLVPVHAGAFDVISLQPTPAAPPRLELASVERGIVFNATGRTPYVLVAHSHYPTFRSPGYRGSVSQAAPEASFPIATLTPYGPLQSFRDKLIRITGPLLLIALLAAGAYWMAHRRKQPR